MSDETNIPASSSSEADANNPPVAPSPGYALPNQPNPVTPPGGPMPSQGSMPPPGYPPPYAGNMPSGYPPYASNMPPPGYPPPYAGNVPPGYPPLPQYFMPMEFPPPPAYAVPPPYLGYPWEIIPPAQGNLVQAWFVIATNLSRRTIAAQAQAMQQNWMTWSIGVGVVLAAIAGVVKGIRLIDYPNLTTNLANNPQGVQYTQTFQNIFAGEAIVTIIITPLTLIINAFVAPWFWSFFMTPLLGSPRQRFQRALKPFALVQPIIGTISLVEALISLVVYALAPAFAPITFLVSIPLSVYSIALSIQVGSVGSGLKRWPVFGIQLLSTLAVAFAFTLIAVIVLVIFIVAQPH